MSDGVDLDLYWERFIHRVDNFAEQKQIERDGKKEWTFLRVFDGFCRHTPRHRLSECPSVNPVSITRKHLQEHLDGEQTYGVYQLMDGTIKWVCFDVDINKGEEINRRNKDRIREITTQISKRLDDCRVPHLIEFSGNKGMHVWVFFSEPVTAAKGMAFGRFILDEVTVDVECHVELFPKQVTATHLGSVVKLPFALHRKSGLRSCFLTRDFEQERDQWAALRKVRPLTPQGLDNFLDYFEIDVSELERIQTRGAEENTHNRGLPCFNTLMASGASEGGRDELTFRLAVYLKNHGMSEPMVYASLDTWNEQNDPPLSDETLRRKVESAFLRDYSHYPCLIKEMDPYCDSSCPFYENKMKKKKRSGR